MATRGEPPTNGMVIAKMLLKEGLMRLLGVLMCLFLAGCGLKLGFPTATQTQSGQGQFTEGFYVASADVPTRHYPLLAIGQKNAELRSFQLSTVGQMAFLVGTRSKDLKISVLYTAITKGLDVAYVGSIRTEGSLLRLQSRKFKEADENDPKFPEVGDVLSGQEYTLKSVPKNDALKQLRTLRNLPKGTTFSPTEEDVCLAAFDLNCNDVYFTPLR